MKALKMMLRDWTLPNLAALSALGIAAGVCLAEVARARALAPLPEAAAPAVRGFPVLAARAAEGDHAGDRFTLLAGDPFRPDRAYVEGRYDPEATDAQDGAGLATTVAAPAPSVRLQGLAFLPSGRGLAVLSVGGRPAQLVRPGQVVGDGLRLTRIDSAAVTLVGPDTTIVLRLPNGARGAAPAGASLVPPSSIAAGRAEGAQP